MKIGFLFPGQGAQTIGMGKDIYDKYEEVREIYNSVEKLTGIDVAKITFFGTEEQLRQTKNTQISILTMSLAILEILKNNKIVPDCMAGLSLGEYSGLIYSEILSFEDGVRIVEQRGKIMQELVPQGEWAMAAVIGIADNVVEEVCKNVSTGFVVPANYNCPGQIAISGEKIAVEEAAEKLKNLGAKMVKVLNVSGPFHTDKLLKCSEALGEELKKINIHKCNIPLYKNIDGTLYSENDDIKAILTNHIIKPVRFSKTLQNMVDIGVDTFIEIGPGKILTGFVRKINTKNKINVLNISNVENLEKTIELIKNMKRGSLYE